MDDRQRLKAVLVERSLRTGDFTLASGARSKYYIDARRTTMSSEGQFLTGKVCWQALQDTGYDLTHVGGLTMGADPIAYAIAHRSWLEDAPLDGFSIRKQPKGHGAAQQVEGGLPAGARCVVVEDTMTTGTSALKACSLVEEVGAEGLAVLTLVDREEGGEARIRESGYPFMAVFSGGELLTESAEKSSV